jgi:hypothetical protein
MRNVSYFAVIWESKYFRIDKVHASKSVDKNFIRISFIDSLFTNAKIDQYSSIYGDGEYVDVFISEVFTTLSEAKHSIIRDFFNIIGQ